MRHSTYAALILSAAVSVLATDAVAQQGSSEDLARRQFESGLAFMLNDEYDEALQDFETVADVHGQSLVADDALLEIARYYLDIAKNPNAARAATERLLNNYPNSSAAPMAHVTNGLIVLAEGRTPEDIEAALAAFERVARLFPESNAVPAALYYAGEARRLARQPAQALERYRQVTADYLSSPWAARSHLGAAICLTQLGRPLEALPEMQRVREDFPGTLEAEVAVAWNTILYRLYLRGPTRPPYRFSGQAVGNDLRDVRAIGVNHRDRLVVVTKENSLLFDGEGRVATSARFREEARALLFDKEGVLLTAHEGELLPTGGNAISLSVAKPDGEMRRLKEIRAARSRHHSANSL